MASQRRPTFRKLLSMYLSHSFELRMKFGLSITRSMMHVLVLTRSLITPFGWENMINFSEVLVAKVLGMAFDHFC